jgi:hypothetical protein
MLRARLAAQSVAFTIFVLGASSAPKTKRWAMASGAPALRMPVHVERFDVPTPGTELATHQVRSAFLFPIGWRIERAPPLRHRIISVPWSFLTG